MSNYTRRTIKGASITFLFSVMAAIVIYIFRVMLARHLGPTEYGLFYAVFTFIIFFLFIRDLGLGSALVKFISKFRALRKYNSIKTSISSVLLFQLISSVFLGIILFSFSDYLALYYFKNRISSTIIRILALYIVGSVSFIIIKGIFRGFQEMTLYASVELSKNVLVITLTYIFFQNGIGIMAPVWAYTITSFALFFLYLPFAMKKFSFFSYKIIEFKPIFKKIIFFGIPLFATSIADRVIGYIDTLFLTYFRSLSEVGIYNVILPSVLLLLKFGFAFSAIIFPLVSEISEKKNLMALKKGIILFYKYIFVILIPPFIVVSQYANELIISLFGVEYGGGITAFQILLFGVFLFNLALINNNIIAAFGEPKMVARITIFAAIFNVIANLILIPKYGIFGAALTTTISYSIVTILTVKYMKNKFYLKLPYLIWIKQAFIAGITWAIVIAVNNFISFSLIYNILVSAIIATVTFIGFLVLFKVINLNEIRGYLSKK